MKRGNLSEETHIGDGVYATIDELGAIWLTQGGTDLEPHHVRLSHVSLEGLAQFCDENTKPENETNKPALRLVRCGEEGNKNDE